MQLLHSLYLNVYYILSYINPSVELSEIMLINNNSTRSRISLQIWACIGTVLTADTVAIGEVNYYNCILQLRSLE